MQQLTALQSEVQEWQDLIRHADEMVEMYEMASSEGETSVLEDIGTEAESVGKQLAALRLRTLMSGPHDKRDAIKAKISGLTP